MPQRIKVPSVVRHDPNQDKTALLHIPILQQHFTPSLTSQKRYVQKYSCHHVGQKISRVVKQQTYKKFQKQDHLTISVKLGSKTSIYILP